MWLLGIEFRTSGKSLQLQFFKINFKKILCVLVFYLSEGVESFENGVIGIYDPTDMSAGTLTWALCMSSKCL